MEAKASNVEDVGGRALGSELAQSHPRHEPKRGKRRATPASARRPIG
jgi:hypothetical protein